MYGRRWSIETDFAHLKTNLQLDVLRCKTVEGVGKELAMSALVYNLVRLVMLEASRRQRVERVSLVDAARWLAQAMEYGAVPPLKLRVDPHRPDLVEPQAWKRRPKEYALLNKPRREMRERLENAGNAP